MAYISGIMEFFDVLTNHYEHELFDELLFYYDIVPKAYEYTTDKLYIIAVYLADSYRELVQFENAVKKYKEALVLNEPPTRKQGFSIVDVRYKLAQCLATLGRRREALEVLSHIPLAECPPKILVFQLKTMKGHRSRAKERHVILHRLMNTYPSAYASLSNELKHGIDENVRILIPRATPESFRYFLEASNAAHACFDKAGDIIARMPNLSESRILLLQAAEYFYDSGRRRRAKTYFKMAHDLGLHNARCMGTLARIYYLDYIEMKKMPLKKSSISYEEVNRMMNDVNLFVEELLKYCPHSAESWVAAAYLSLMKGDKEDASAFIKHASLFVQPDQIHKELSVIHATLLMERGDVNDARKVVSELFKEHPKCVDGYEIMCEHYIKVHDPAAGITLLTTNSHVFSASAPARLKMLEARLYLMDNKLQEAIDILRVLTTEVPICIEAGFELLTQYLQAATPECFEEGLALANRLVAVVEEESALHIARLHIRKGDLLHATDKAAEAKACYLQAASYGLTEAEERLSSMSVPHGFGSSPETQTYRQRSVVRETPGNVPGAPRRRRGRSPPGPTGQPPIFDLALT